VFPYIKLQLLAKGIYTKKEYYGNYKNFHSELLHQKNPLSIDLLPE